MFEKEKKYFPIKTKTACQLKWAWSTIHLPTGETRSCHRCERQKINQENFDDFHNLPHKVKEREIMLRGKWPTKENGGSGHCNFCKVHEDVGEKSDRQRQLEVPNLVPKELLGNQKETRVTPTILELYLNNTCNMKCVYCIPEFSSRWQSELEKFGNIHIDDEINQVKLDVLAPAEQKILFNKCIDWIDRKGTDLKRLHILGGEPFYQDEFKVLLDFLATKKFPNLELNIISNLMTKSDVFVGYIEKIKRLLSERRIARFDLTASIDNWGEQAEYARSGLKIEYWKKMFEYCVQQKWIYLNINNTVSSLTIKTLPDLLDYINVHKKHRQINHHGGEVRGLNYLLHPKIYGKKFWEEDFKQIFSKMDTNDPMLPIMKGIFKSLPDSTPNAPMVKKLKEYLDILDVRRNTNWRSVFPYLDI